MAQYLSKKLNYVHIDLDDQIVLIEEQSIPEIFNKRGELYFRKRETDVLEDVLEDSASLVVAMGGGTPCYGKNLEIIKSSDNAKIVYLQASVQFLTERLQKEANQRPVISHLKTTEELEDFIRKHLFERSYYYNQADVVVNVEHKTPEEITNEIIGKLK